jgi:hypothetical protein
MAAHWALRRLSRQAATQRTVALINSAVIPAVWTASSQSMGDASEIQSGCAEALFYAGRR